MEIINDFYSLQLLLVQIGLVFDVKSTICSTFMVSESISNWIAGYINIPTDIW